jgi:hypothetical protein
MINNIRSLVRPLALGAIVAGVVYLCVFDIGGNEGLVALSAFGGPIVGWWFHERSQKNGGGTP